MADSRSDCLFQSSSTNRSTDFRRTRKVRVRLNDTSSGAVRRLDLNKEDVSSEFVVGPTTRQQWCQQWLKTDSSKENNIAVSSVYFNRQS